MLEIQSPNSFKTEKPFKSDIFIGGSIEMGTAENWQQKFINHFKEKDFRFLNPRRNDWNSNWIQDISNPQFKEQVSWELDALDYSDLIVFYFDPNTKSPITLMELGLHASSGKCIVCCPKGFWRKGNVDIVCERHNIPMYDSFNSLIKGVEELTKNWKF